MALLLRESHVEQLLTMQSTLALVERVHREYSTGNAIDVPRERTRLPKAALHILQGAVPSAGVFGYKAYTSSREGVRFLVYVFSAENGRLDAIVEANYLGMMRTGAAGGVAAKWLAREDAKVVGLFGSGWQARGQVDGTERGASAVELARDRGAVGRGHDEHEPLEAAGRLPVDRCGAHRHPAHGTGTFFGDRWECN